jgi:hypothetical protein
MAENHAASSAIGNPFLQNKVQRPLTYALAMCIPATPKNSGAISSHCVSVRPLGYAYSRFLFSLML